jgi:hypothetical protein
MWKIQDMKIAEIARAKQLSSAQVSRIIKAAEAETGVRE